MTRIIIRESHKPGLWKIKIGYNKKWIWMSKKEKDAYLEKIKDDPKYKVEGH